METGLTEKTIIQKCENTETTGETVKTRRQRCRTTVETGETGLTRKTRKQGWGVRTRLVYRLLRMFALAQSMLFSSYEEHVHDAITNMFVTMY